MHSATARGTPSRDCGRNQMGDAGQAIRELFIEELAGVQGGAHIQGLDNTTMACCEEGPIGCCEQDPVEWVEDIVDRITS